jgi:phage shock protein A
MIPLWLTPRILKVSGVLIAIMAVYFLGWHTHARLHEAALLRLKSEITTLSANYRQSTESLQRCMSNFDRLEKVLDSQNAAILKMAEDTKIAIDRANKMRDEAIAREKALHEQSLQTMQAEYARLYEKWAVLSASEACHESWLEVTNVQ